jgi:integrase
MSIILPKGGKTFRYEFMLDGKLYRGSTGVEAVGQLGSKTFLVAKARAKKFADEHKSELKAAQRIHQRKSEAERTLGIRDSTGNTIIPTFKEAADKYLENVGIYARNAEEDAKHIDWLEEKIRAETLITEIRNATVQRIMNLRADTPKLSKERRDRKTGAVIPPQRQVMNLSTGQLRPFVEGADDPQKIVKLSPAYVNRSCIDILKRIISHARVTMEVPGMPEIKWGEYRRSEPRGRTRTLSHTEEALLDPYLREGYGAAFQFATMSGFRLSNFTETFTWRQVSFEQRRITIIQKGGSEHTIMMTDQMEEFLRAQVGRDPVHVFVFRFKGVLRGRNGDQVRAPWKNPRNGQTYIPGALYPVTYWGFDSWFDQIKKETGLSDVRNHDLRRTAASRVIRAIGNPKVAAKLLGHASEAMVRAVYNQIKDEEAFEDLNIASRRIAEQKERELAILLPCQNPKILACYEAEVV